MSIGPKHDAEGLTTLKTTGATASEAASAVNYLRALSTDPEAPADTRAAAVLIGRELEALPGDSVRREALMARASALASKVN